MKVVEVYRCCRCGKEIHHGLSWEVPEHVPLSGDSDVTSPLIVVNPKKLLHCCSLGKWGKLVSAGLDAVEDTDDQKPNL